MSVGAEDDERGFALRSEFHDGVVRVADHEVRTRCSFAKLILDKSIKLLPRSLVRFFLESVQINIPVRRDWLANVQHQEPRNIFARENMGLMQSCPR
jgi:hypothetical protein